MMLSKERQKSGKEIEDAEDRHTKYKETGKEDRDVESKYKNYKEIGDSLRI